MIFYSAWLQGIIHHHHQQQNHYHQYLTSAIYLVVMCMNKL